MGTSGRAREILGQFLSSAQEWGRRRGYAVEADSLGPNFIRVARPRGEWLLYVKIRSRGPGFWGVTRSRVQRLQAGDERWAVDLLVGGPERGYLVPDSRIIVRSRDDWTLSSDGDYKVNEGRDVDASEGLRCVGECLERLIGMSS